MSTNYLRRITERREKISSCKSIIFESLISVYIVYGNIDSATFSGDRQTEPKYMSKRSLTDNFLMNDIQDGSLYIPPNNENRNTNAPRQKKQRLNDINNNPANPAYETPVRRISTYNTNNIFVPKEESIGMDELSPMRDMEPFYDDNNEVVFYRNMFGDEMSIRNKIQSEIEAFVRGNDTMDTFWKTINDIVNTHQQTIDAYREHQGENNTIADFTKDDLYSIFSDYFSEEMDKSVADIKSYVESDADPSLSKKEREESLRDVQRYEMIRDNLFDIIRKYNIEEKGEVGGTRRRRRKSRRISSKKSKAKANSKLKKSKGVKITKRRENMRKKLTAKKRPPRR